MPTQSTTGGGSSNPIERKQLEVLTKQTPLAVFANCAIGGILTVAIHDSVKPDTLYWWYGAVVVAAGLRMALAIALRRRVRPIEAPVVWLRAYAVLAALSGMAWGAASLLYMRPEQPTVFTLTILAIGGMASGAVGSLSAYLPAYLLFSSLTLFPITVRFAYLGGAAGSVITLMSLTYILAVFSFARVANRTMLEAIRLRFAIEDLVRQLTDEKERALLAQERAEHAVLAKSRFLAAASHDLRQPVHALSLFVGALKPKGESDPELAFVADRIEASALALKSLLDGLLDISRLDAGSIEPKPEPVPLSRVMQKIATELAATAEEGGLELRSVPTSKWARTDPEMLERIVRNLVSNAIRYTPRGKVLIGCRRGRPLRLCVWDTGIGIPEHQTEEIFAEFCQLHNPERDRSKGLGLGLAIVRRLAALLGHRVSVRSRPGRGSCFSVDLEEARPQPLVDSHDDVHPSPTALGDRSILVVDDESLARDALRTILESWGCTVYTAASLDEAVATATARLTLDVALVDYRLRDHLTGFDVVVAVEQSLGYKIPAIFITGDTAPERIREAERTGYPLLHKPLSPGRLHLALEAALTSASSKEHSREPSSVH